MSAQLVCPNCKSTYFEAVFTRVKTETLETTRRLIIFDDDNEDWGLEREFDEEDNEITLPNGDTHRSSWIDTVDLLVSDKTIKESEHGQRDLRIQEHDGYDNLSVISQDVEEEVTLNMVMCQSCGEEYRISIDFDGYNSFDE